jgi:hypothetical protein
MSRVLSSGMDPWACEVGFSTVVWTVVFCRTGRGSDPMKWIGGLIARATTRGLLWTPLSMVEAQKANAMTIGMRSDRRRSVKPIIGYSTMLVNDKVLRRDT